MSSSASSSRAGRGHDERHAHLAHARVGHADHRDATDRRMAEQQVLDLGRVGVEPADDEHVLACARRCAGSRARRGCRGRRCATTRRRRSVRRGRVRIVEVAAHHAVAAHQQLAGVARPACSTPSSSTTRISRPGRTRPTVVAIVSKSSSGPVAVTVPASVRPYPVTISRERQLLVHPPDQLDGDVGRAGDRQTQGRQVVRGHGRDGRGSTGRRVGGPGTPSPTRRPPCAAGRRRRTRPSG